MKRILLVLAMLLPVSAFADVGQGTPKFTITLPTTNVDGSTIPATGTTALKEWRLYCDGISLPKKVVAVPVVVWQTVVGDFLAGPHTCQATVATNGSVESARTNAVNFTVPTIPSAPGSLIVE